MDMACSRSLTEVGAAVSPSSRPGWWLVGVLLGAVVAEGVEGVGAAVLGLASEGAAMPVEWQDEEAGLSTALRLTACGCGCSCPRCGCLLLTNFSNEDPGVTRVCLKPDAPIFPFDNSVEDPRLS